MKFIVSIIIIVFVLWLPAFSSYTLTEDVKAFFKKKYPVAEFKIDNSFTVGDIIYLPLIPEKINEQKKIEIITLVHDKNQIDFPRLIQLSNGLIFVKLLKTDEEKSTILDVSLLPESIKNNLLRTRFPSDLVVPKSFFLNEELAVLKGELSIKEPVLNTEDIKKENISFADVPLYKFPEGLLYFTSPDSGRIVFLDFADFSMINFIQTQGIPWAIAPYMSEFILVSDFSKNLIYKIEPGKLQISDSINLSEMIRPADIGISEDGSLIYVLDSLTSEFVVYQAEDLKVVVKTKTPVNPTKFLVLKELNLIVVLSPSVNSVTFLNSNDFSVMKKIKVESNPEAAIFNVKNYKLYIAQRNGKSISVIDPVTFKEATNIEVDDTPIALAIDSSGRMLYVASGKTNTINVIDTDINKVIDTILLPPETQFPGDIKIASDERSLIVTSETTNTISIVDLVTRNQIRNINLGFTTHETTFLSGRKN